MIRKLRACLTDLGAAFWGLWFGQTVSVFGTQLVQFGLAVWIVQQSGSVMSYMGSIVAATVPAILMLPLAGSVVDRVDRRYIMIVADSIAMLSAVVLVILLWRQRLQIYHLYLFNIVAALAGAFQGPAYQASISALLPKEQYTRGISVISSSTHALAIVTPTLAGALIVLIGVPGLALIDLVTFVMGTLFVWRAFAALSRPGLATTWRELLTVSVTSFRHFLSTTALFRSDGRLLRLFGYRMVQSCSTSLATIMLVPLVLANHTPPELGVMIAWGAGGALSGSLLLVVISNPRRPILWMLMCDALCAACISGLGLATSALGYGAFVFIASALAAVTASCATALWLRNVDPQRQGSVLVLLHASALTCVCLSTLFGGKLIDSVFSPALHRNGWLVQSFGAWLDAEKGGGLRVMFVLSGMVGLIASVIALSSKQVRGLA